jgi:subtilase family serine protease
MLHVRGGMKTSARSIGLLAVGALLLAPLSSASAAAVASGRHAASAAGAGGQARVAVGVAPRLPAGARAVGPAAASARLDFDIALRPVDPAALRAYATAVSTRGSADYRHFLTTSQFAARFGQPLAAIRRATAALRSVGLTPGRVSANHLLLQVRTTVGRASAGLRTAFQSVALRSGRLAVRNTSAPKLPASVARITQGVIGLNSMLTVHAVPPAAPARSRRLAVRPQVVGAPSPCASVLAASDYFDGWTYDQLAKAYQFTGLYNKNYLGKRTTVALFELENWSAADISAFQGCYKTNATISTEPVDGGATGSPGVEATLDIETVAALAPQANILVYSAPSTNYATSALAEYTQIVTDDRAQVLSTSYGICESEVHTLSAGLIPAENTVFEEAATEGMTVMVAAGDSGSEACYQYDDTMTQLSVQDPASQPFVTSVGGTELTALGPAPTEVVWNEHALSEGAGGGGISSEWDMPTWQTGVIGTYSSDVPCGNLSGDCREVPDVSASADPQHPYVIAFDGDWEAVGGTSAAAPLWAALIADIDSSTSQPSRVGFLNPTLYALPAGTFNDVTVGNNDYTETHGGKYPAVTGYDMASGLGTPIGTKLYLALHP